MKESLIRTPLFERSAKHFAQVYGYPPCTAKIFSLMLLDFERNGITFEQITERFGMSKSTVSEALAYLLKENHIAFFQKEKDRKRYFKINPDFMKIRYQTIAANLSEEQSILDEISDHMLEHGQSDVLTMRKFEIISKTIEKSIQNLQNAIKKLETT